MITDPWTARKSPFPVALKAEVRAAGRVCFENEMLSERDEERRQGLFMAICSCLPYNATTLKVSPSQVNVRWSVADMSRNSFIDCVSKITGTFYNIARTQVSSE